MEPVFALLAGSLGGMVVPRPLPLLLLLAVSDDSTPDLARGRALRRGEGRSGRAGGLLAMDCGAGSVVGSGKVLAVVGAASRLLMTVFTPSTCPASLAAGFPAGLPLTFPGSVNMPLLALIG